MPRKKSTTPKAPAEKKPKLNRNRDVGDPTFDLLKVFHQKSLGDMSDEELEKCVEDLQKLRLMRFTNSKRKTPLDKILAAITPDRARIILEQFKVAEAEVTK